MVRSVFQWARGNRLEREQFATAFPQARYGAGGGDIRHVDDAMEVVVADLGQGMLRRFTDEIPQFTACAGRSGAAEQGSEGGGAPGSAGPRIVANGRQRRAMTIAAASSRR